MASKLETLNEKLAKLQGEIEAEAGREAVETATAEVRDTFSEAITAAIAIVEKDTGKSLRDIHLGVWVAYPPGDKSTLTVSALTVGEDGLPAALKRKVSTNGTNGNGNGNGHLYKLGDGRTFDTCEAAVNALGVDTRDAQGDFLEGKQYYHRHDRLPKELKEKIEKVDKPPEAPEAPEAPDAPEAGATAEAPEAPEAAPTAEPVAAGKSK